MPKFTKRAGVRRAEFTTNARGVGGEFPLPVGRAESIRIGGFTITRPVTAFPVAGTFGVEGKAGHRRAGSSEALRKR